MIIDLIQLFIIECFFVLLCKACSASSWYSINFVQSYFVYIHINLTISVLLLYGVQLSIPQSPNILVFLYIVITACVIRKISFHWSQKYLFSYSCFSFSLLLHVIHLKGSYLPWIENSYRRNESACGSFSSLIRLGEGHFTTRLRFYFSKFIFKWIVVDDIDKSVKL